MARQLGVTLREFRRFVNVRYPGPEGVVPSDILGPSVFLEAREYFEERRRAPARPHQAQPPTRR